jgi:hypothetical protein
MNWASYQAVKDAKYESERYANAADLSEFSAFSRFLCKLAADGMPE